MNFIAEFCIKRKVTTIMAFIMIIIFGLMSFTTLPLALMPNIEIPMAVVMTTYQAGPEEVENLVTKKIEGACASTSGLDEMSSISSDRMSLVIISFADGVDLTEAITDLRDKVNQVEAMLPDNAGTPTIMKINMDAMPVVAFSLSGDDLSVLQKLAEDTISPELEKIDGVASVTIVGGYEEEVAINTYATQLAGYGITPAYIAGQLAAGNVTMPVGDINNGTGELNARLDGEFDSVDDIKNALITLPTGGTVKLSELANVNMQSKDQTGLAKMDGEPCVRIAVSKQSDTNTVEISEKVMKSLEKLKNSNEDISYQIIMDQSDYINLSVQSVAKNIAIAVILATIILVLFLRNGATTFILAIAMPICIISVFLIMNLFDITLNLMSLGGLAMGVGMIVDNSIVVLENIYRFKSEGVPRFEACVKGAGEVALAIAASTLTTVAVFLPIGLSGGTAGMLFKEFTITIATLMLASLVIALTLIPLLCYLFMDRGKHSRVSATGGVKILDSKLMKKYIKLLDYFLRKRKVAVLVSIVSFIGCIVLIISAGVELIPTMDQSSITISAELPMGSEIKDCEEIGDRIVKISESTLTDSIESISYATGSQGMDLTGGSNSISVNINLVSVDEREKSAQTLSNELQNKLNNIAGAEITVSGAGTTDMSSIGGDAISVEVSGTNYDDLNMVNNDLVKLISQIPDASNVTSSASDQTPQVNIYVNRENAARFGLTSSTIGTTVYNQLSGTSQTKLRISGEEIDINVTGDERLSESLDEVKNIMLATPSGGSVPLSLVADVKVELAPQSISRTNQSRTITITGSSLSDNTMGIYAEVNKVIESYKAPDGITITSGGEMQEMQESYTQLFYALIVAIGLVYFILASQFESFVIPIIIMLILPIGLISSLVGLPLTGQQISMPAFIGVIMLAGIVVNSSIVLVDYIIRRRKDYGEDKNTAILNAAPRRVRPILMTSLTTILGLIPMVIGGGEGSEMMAPMAMVMITGMVISTIITLLFTPVYYSLVDSFVNRVKRKKA